MKNLLKYAVLTAIVMAACVCSYVAYKFLIHPQPAPKTETLFQGVEYIREIRFSPRDMVIHVVIVDLKAEGIRTLVTPGDPDASLPLEARTTSEFLKDFEVQLAINGDAFIPGTPLPFWTTTRTPGTRWTPSVWQFRKAFSIHPPTRRYAPTLYFSADNKARFDRPWGQVYNAISGSDLILRGGNILAGGGSSPEPRTAIGLNRSANKLIIIIVDGRQPGYSEGATLIEMAELLIEHGAIHGMNLDGGGSTTLVIQTPLGGARVLNSPIDGNIPGRERNVGNHLGIFANPR